MLLLASVARAVPVRRVFEPSQLAFENPGVAQFGMQFGLVRGESAYRVSAPLFLFDLGLTPNIELDLDGEFAYGGPDDGEFIFNQTAPDNLWTSVKVGLFDFGDENNAWTSGIKIGPKAPLAHGNQGAGVEGLLLLGWRNRQMQLVLNLGGLIDPAAEAHTPRPRAVEGGLELNYPLEASGRWILTGELSGIRYLSPDNDQLNVTFGITWSPSDMLDLSIAALGGPLAGGDRWGLLFGISPRVQLW